MNYWSHNTTYFTVEDYMSSINFTRVGIDEANIFIDSKMPSFPTPNTLGIFNIDPVIQPTSMKAIKGDYGSIVHLDYSMHNVNEAKKFGSIISEWVPFQMCDQVETIRAFMNVQESANAVAHVGTRTDRRKIAIKNMRNKIDVHQRVGWKDKRDRGVVATKLLMNIHRLENKNNHIFEHGRCDPYILAGFPVVSETSCDEVNLDIKDLVVFVSLDDMPEKIGEILDNYEEFMEAHKERYNKIIKNILKSREDQLNKVLSHFCPKNTETFP